MAIKETLANIKENVTPEEVKEISYEGVKSFTKGLMAGAGTFVAKKGLPIVTKYGVKAAKTLMKVKVF